mmetsp:Transcript_12119/g.13640  ORF Transcript_12119/g.13640 Transcript_12119/m.13640 type:complete len:265 (+) Transcript_12119:27-821(+)
MSRASCSRIPLLGGNWKCNLSVKRVRELVSELNEAPTPRGMDVVIAPTFLHIAVVASSVNQTFEVAAQDVSQFPSGAHTGDLSAAIVKDVGLRWVIVGHSERRQQHAEADEVVGAKVEAAQKEGLNVIACIGETLAERKAGRTMDVLIRQLRAIAGSVQDWRRIVIAYEPVWAIGTGLSASPEQAQEVHLGLRQWISQHCGEAIALALRIIYGGSVKPKTAASLIAKADIDGFLVGGASLKGPSFSAIATSIEEAFGMPPRSKL